MPEATLALQSMTSVSGCGVAITISDGESKNFHEIDKCPSVDNVTDQISSAKCNLTRSRRHDYCWKPGSVVMRYSSLLQRLNSKGVHQIPAESSIN